MLALGYHAAMVSLSAHALPGKSQKPPQVGFYSMVVIRVSNPVHILLRLHLDTGKSMFVYQVKAMLPRYVKSSCSYHEAIPQQWKWTSPSPF